MPTHEPQEFIQLKRLGLGRLRQGAMMLITPVAKYYFNFHWLFALFIHLSWQNLFRHSNDLFLNYKSGNVIIFPVINFIQILVNCHHIDLILSLWYSNALSSEKHSTCKNLENFASPALDIQCRSSKTMCPVKHLPRPVDLTSEWSHICF